MRLQAKDMPPNTIFLYRGEWYIKKEDFRVDGRLYNCITDTLQEPDYAILDDYYYCQKSLKDSILYRKFDNKKVDLITRVCENNSIDYIFYNPEDYFLANNHPIEIGMSRDNWDKLKKLIPTIL